ncbi:N-acetylglucosaminyl-diphospho-decaprenol L-rhamnosyltransferase [compost metagenome]
MNPSIAVAIVNYNTRELLSRCLEVLFAQELSVDYEVWVADNASSDGSVEMLAEQYPQVKVIANSENLGFAEANNQIMRETQADSVFLLNTDTEIRKGALQALWDLLQAQPRHGMVAAALVNPDGTPQPSVVPARFPWAFSPVDREERLRWASGAAVLVRAETIREIGLLDPRFFYTGEDCDWGLRARRAGWLVMAAPHAVVMHIGGATRKDLPKRSVEAIQMGRQHYFSKHYGSLGLAYARLHSTIELTGLILKTREDSRFYLDLLGRCWAFRPEPHHG